MNLIYLENIVFNKQFVVKNVNNILKYANDYISKTINSNKDIQNNRLKAINILQKFVDCLEVTDYLLIDSKPEISRDIFLETHFTLGTLYKNLAEYEIQNQIDNLRKHELNKEKIDDNLSQKNEETFRKAINCFQKILFVSFDDQFALKQITSIFTQLCLFSQNNLMQCLRYLEESLFYTPDNETIHYNLGYIYQRLNKLELSIIHYKISIKLANSKEKETNETKEVKEEMRKLLINNYNGISSIFRSIKKWPEALHYLQKAEKIDQRDPDIQNQLGIVYTEMRRTDLAEKSYIKAIENYKKTFISTDPKFFLSEIYLNYGHMHSYNGDNTKSVENYNKSLQICPKFSLPFQNKLMNLSYLFDQFDDKMYIYNQHKLTNKLYKKGNNKYKFDKSFYNSNKINIGIISGDFVDHPVSFFISTFLKNFDNNKFNVTCYSECIIDTTSFNEKLQFKTIKNMSNEHASDMIYTDKIHILFDLAGRTAFNRLDIFAMKPSPIQITYVGYPFSTGLDEMDYRITDNICDGDFSVSQKFYTEKLIALKNCFLCYNPGDTIIRDSELKRNVELKRNQQNVKEKELVIGCFNRINKITDNVIKMYNNILLSVPNTKFVFKTKALINKKIATDFINKFNKNVRSRIEILDCTISHRDHLLTYNNVDIAIDTFPYSGTTTTCEALYMGVPVFSLYDSTYYFHPQNVSCSILKNSDLDFYVVNSEEEMICKIKELKTKDIKELKIDTRSKFLNGKVCDSKEYMKNIQTLLLDLYNKENNKK